METGDLSLVREALAEDLAGYGDVTSSLTVPADLAGRASIAAREDLVMCGLPLAEIVAREVDPGLTFVPLVQDGAFVSRHEEVAAISGSARAILTAERTMLNFLSHLSGVATQSRRFAQAVEGTGSRVIDTRKTTPGLRSWEKRAVVLGGCGNHRFGLFDLVLIKNNHLVAAGGVRTAVERAKQAKPHYLQIEVEVENEADLLEAIAAGADIVMLDNQDIEALARLVGVARAVRPDIVLEASGGISLATVRRAAEAGVDLISTSALTMGAPPADLSLTLLMGHQAADPRLD